VAFSPGSLSAVAPPEAAPRAARLDVWNSIPGLSSGVASSEGDNLEITVSAEMYQKGGSVWFRALVDGEVAEPSDVVFKSGSVEFDGIRTFTFVKPAVKAGQHLVEIQWLTGTAKIRDRTLTVYSASPFIGSGHLAVATAPSGPDIEKNNSTYEDIPGMLATIAVSQATTLAVVFSAEASASSGRFKVRALANGSQVGEVIFCEGGDPNRGGTRAFTFVRALLPANTYEVKLQWKSTGGACRLGDRTMSVSAAPVGTQCTAASVPSSAKALTKALVWVDLPVSITLNAADPVSTLSVTFSGEVTSNKGRIFLRALVDGAPASPSDVTLIEGGSKWRVASHTFIVKNLPRGRHQIGVQAMVDPSTKGQIRRSSLRALCKRRSGSDFVQPFLGMTPLVRTCRMLVIGFDPVRPGQDRPPFAMIKATFEGAGLVVNDPTATELSAARLLGPFDEGPNVRAWLAENSGGVARLGEVRYVGCLDSGWYVAPPERQGNWYWDNGAFEQMWKDALAAADPDVNFHGYDTDHDNLLETDELLVAIVRPQNGPYGTKRQTSAPLDNVQPALTVPLLDLYLSSRSEGFLTGVGVTCHELSHLIFGTVDCTATATRSAPAITASWTSTGRTPISIRSRR
jgi:hypothetical protein